MKTKQKRITFLQIGEVVRMRKQVLAGCEKNELVVEIVENRLNKEI